MNECLLETCSIGDLYELFRKPSDDDERGRQSGEAAWRLDRGEIQSEELPKLPKLEGWHINPSDLINDSATIRYSATKDVYEFLTGGVVKGSRKKWSEGCYTHFNLIRKEERDWKQVYIARRRNKLPNLSILLSSFKFIFRCWCRSHNVAI